LVLALAGGMGVPLYLALWLLVPADDSPTSIAEDLLDRYLPETLR
jgi:phage shock protein PspC (stress-responsive transcriptional regulator)